jgi:HEAT repeat protein
MADQLDRWLRLLGGSEWEGPEGRDRAVREMRALGTDTVFPMLARKLSDVALETRCAAIKALSLTDAGRAVALLLPLLRDPDVVIRLSVCQALRVPEAQAAVQALVEVLRSDPDPQVRGYAAGALGHIGSPAAIPALLRAMDADHEPDVLGHTPGHSAASALDDLLGTNMTRIRLSESLCTLRPGPPDLEGLRRLAVQAYEAWSGGPAQDSR